MKYRYSFFILLFTFIASAQVQPIYPVKKAEGRPTIGLCLSGGGAKGFAHIGVLKIIDSLGIPVDYVTGTSMGAIMGGLYAIGYTGKQIEESVLSTDWLALMSTSPERQYESFSTKDYAERNLFTVGLDGFSIVLPAGLNNASKVYQKLHNVTIGYHGQRNFLEFKRGFICIGADLNTGEEVVFTEGSLPDAMRASMAIPSIFTPHQVNGITVVDGGTLNNFPTDKLVELGCDIIIGVDLQSPPKKSDIVSLTEVLEKSAMFINKRNYKPSVARCDIHIHPNMTGYTGGDFDQATGIITRGTAAGKQHMQELVELANSLKGTPKKEIEPYVVLDSVVLKRIDLLGLKKVSKSYVLGVIDYDGGNISIEDLETSMNALDGSQYFNTVSYNLFAQDDQTYVLEINVNENPNDLDIGVGLHYDPDFETSLLINLAARNALIKGSRFSLDAVVSPIPRFRLLYEVDRGFKPGFGIRSNLFFTRPEVIENNASSGRFNYNDWTTGLYMLFSANNKAALRLGGEFNLAYYNFRDVPFLKEILDPENNNPNATQITFDHVNFFTEIAVDVLDDFNYPTKGHYFFGAARYHTAQLKNLESVFDNHFLSFYVQYKAALSPTNWLTLIPELTGGLGIALDGGQNYSFNYYYNLGGLGRNYFHYQTPFLGYQYNELFGLTNLAKAGLEARFNPFGKHYVSGLFNYAFTVNRLTISEATDEDFINLYGWGMKYSIDTFLGPLEITAHKNLESGPWLFYFNLGYWF